MKTADTTTVTVIKEPELTKKPELGVGAGSVGAEVDGVGGVSTGTEGVSTVGGVGVGSVGVITSSSPQSNSQYEVVVDHAPAKRTAGTPEGLSSSLKKMIDSASISPRVLSS